MPEYTYTDGEHLQVEYHAAGTHPTVTCKICGKTMTRKYSAPRVNWQGLKPSDGEMSPTFKQFFSTVSQRREAFEAHHAAHERAG